MTLFNYWHYIVLSLIFLAMIVGVVKAMQHANKKLAYSMVFSIILISVFMAIFSVIIVDKYTKKVQIIKLHNKRLLSTEEISYYGIVRNVGKFPIGKVTIEIKLVNRGHATGNVKGGNFYKPSGFLEFFTGGFGMLSHKPQTVTKTFVIARDLKAKESQSFRVYFKYPPYFRSTADFVEAYGH